ncbi:MULTISPECIES: hypothetical protein [Cysteiniphilum]|uniref:Uncharacterized protein n=1 Tax=Cysteiniphilum litorale TaxID=2056700 RepID=A0A8J3E8H9_9GAMM|nr:MULTISPECIES: hypothetical protein [Cysteiniphilum]GGF91408.1 hypothetical protein GCM10010995_05810 [Cysteiniphilum litorale]
MSNQTIPKKYYLYEMDTAVVTVMHDNAKINFTVFDNLIEADNYYSRMKSEHNELFVNLDTFDIKLREDAYFQLQKHGGFTGRKVLGCDDPRVYMPPESTYTEIVSVIQDTGKIDLTIFDSMYEAKEYAKELESELGLMVRNDLFINRHTCYVRLNSYQYHKYMKYIREGKGIYDKSVKEPFHTWKILKLT